MRADLKIFCAWEKSLWILEYRRQLTRARRKGDGEIATSSRAN